nr:hypothetical protein [Streptomyces scabiei]
MANAADALGASCPPLVCHQGPALSRRPHPAAPPAHLRHGSA